MYIFENIFQGWEYYHNFFKKINIFLEILNLKNIFEKKKIKWCLLSRGMD
jgi:hypothetical protein